MFLNLDEIKTIQLDHTNRCNLSCPQCARIVGNGQLNQNLTTSKDLKINDYKIILEPFSKQRLKLFFCGNYGDVISSPTFDEALDYIVENHPQHQIVIVTNGSLRSEKWWSDLARKLSPLKNSKVYFSIDGLSDTNSIYRVNSKFEKIIENLKAFVSSGGWARWDYLVFSHNAHQVGEARNLAKSIGVKSFNVKKTSRFILTDEERATTEIKTTKTIVEDIKDNKNKENFEQIKKSHTSFEQYTQETRIICKTKNEKTIYIDFNMRLWPCCWLGAPYLFQDDNQIQKKQIQKVFKKFGEDFNRLDVYGWDLLQSNFYQSYLEKSWEDQEASRLYTCGRTCGEKYEFSSGYGENRNLETL